MAGTNYVGAQKSMGYDHPSYTARQSFAFGPNTAGSGGVTPKFCTHAAILAFGLNALTSTVGSSTYTYTANGTASQAVAATQVSLLAVYGTQSAGATIALTTTSLGPFTVTGGYITAGGGTNTLTNQAGAYTQFQLNTNTGTAGYGGILIPQGAQIWCVNGTDASAVIDYTLDYQIQPLAGVLA